MFRTTLTAATWQSVAISASLVLMVAFAGSMVSITAVAAQSRAGVADPQVAAIIDETASSECEIQHIVYADEARTVVVSDTGALPCAGNGGAVVHKVFMPLSEAEASGFPYVTLTGDPVADLAAANQLTANLAPPSGSPALADTAGVEANGACNVGSYPTYYTSNGSYLVFQYDGGPVDTRIYYSTAYTRLSCQQYRFENVNQSQSNQTVSQLLCFADYWYEDATVGPVYANAGIFMSYPGSHYSYPGWGYNFSPGNFWVRTANGDCSVYLDETWTGVVYINAPQS